MFQFPRLPPGGLCVRPSVRGNDATRVSPFGDPRVERASAPNRGLSQLVASFVGFLCQGIHRLPLPSSFLLMVRTYKYAAARASARPRLRCDLLEENLGHAMQLSRYGEGEPPRPDTARHGGATKAISWEWTGRTVKKKSYSSGRGVSP